MKCTLLLTTRVRVWVRVRVRVRVRVSHTQKWENAEISQKFLLQIPPTAKQNKIPGKEPPPNYNPDPNLS